MSAEYEVADVRADRISMCGLEDLKSADVRLLGELCRSIVNVDMV